MTRREITSEILKALDNVPESVLVDVLRFLKQVEKHSLDDVNLAIHLRGILSEDGELLERLAK